MRRIIDEQYAIARKLIEDNRDKMHAMASALLEWETIDGEQIDDIMAGKPPRPPKDWTPSASKPSGTNPPVSTDGRRPQWPDPAIDACTQRGLMAPFALVPAVSMLWRARVWLRPHIAARYEPRPSARLTLSAHGNLADSALHDRPRASARDGHRQRDAGFLLRRRPPSGQRRRASPIASAWSARAPTSSTSAANPLGRARTRRACRKRLDRVMPVLEHACKLGVPVSADTSRPEVMRAALALGADIINDVRALRMPGALEVVAAHAGCGVCLMHMLGDDPAVMQQAPAYDDVVADVRSFLHERMLVIQHAGVAKSACVLDPGIGFGKTPEHNWALMQGLDKLLTLGQPLLIGWSRKSMLGALTGRAEERSPARAAWPQRWPACNAARSIVRVHDVAATVDALAVWRRSGLVELAAGGRQTHAPTQRRRWHDATSAPTASAARWARRRSRLTFCCASAMRWAACFAATAARADGGDRQGHAHLGLHDRVGARSGLSRRPASTSLLSGPIPTPGGGLPDARAAPGPRRGDQRLAQPVPRQRHQVLLGRTARSCPTTGSWRSRRALGESPQWVDSASLGKARRIDDASGRYIEFCKSTVRHDLSLRGLKIVIDAAHGAAYHVAPDVFHELGADVVAIGCTPDGLNINDGVGATAPAALVEAVAEHRADYGVALDGDADRLLMVDAGGRVFNGDELLYVMVAERLAKGRRSKARWAP